MTAPLDIAAARALCEAASPAEWRVSSTFVEGVMTLGVFSGSNWVADCHNRHGDAAFIAAARTLVPQLLATVEQLQAELSELQSSDDTAAQKYEAAIDDNLPRYSIGDDCHGEPDEANYIERVEYAGEEIRELKRAERELTERVEQLQRERDEVIGWRDTAQGAARILQNDVWYANEKLKTIEALTRVNTVAAIADWLEQRAQEILNAGGTTFALHRAAGLTDAVDALRAGTWKP